MAAQIHHWQEGRQCEEDHPGSAQGRSLFDGVVWQTLNLIQLLVVP